MAAKKSTRKASAARAGALEAPAVVSRSTSRGNAGALKASKVSPTELDAILERLSDALSIVATATRSLSYSQTRPQADPRPRRRRGVRNARTWRNCLAYRLQRTGRRDPRGPLMISVYQTKGKAI